MALQLKLFCSIVWLTSSHLENLHKKAVSSKLTLKSLPACRNMLKAKFVDAESCSTILENLLITTAMIVTCAAIRPKSLMEQQRFKKLLVPSLEPTNRYM